jgi:predicted RNA-binding Zn-ribbon protein involved in translation (DUF1610 family)
MVSVVVRCGRCRAELDVSGPGEFLCPSCGTRNVVRGASGADPLAGAPGGPGLTLPGGGPAPPARLDGPSVDIDWMRCQTCSFRFAIGSVEKVTCPNCGAELERPESFPLP